MKTVHRVKEERVIKRYKVIPYSELAKVLKEDGLAFLENSSDQPLKRQTVWKAARKLSEMLDQKIVADYALVKLRGGKRLLEGYLFSKAD